MATLATPSVLLVSIGWQHKGWTKSNGGNFREYRRISPNVDDILTLILKGI